MNVILLYQYDKTMDPPRPHDNGVIASLPIPDSCSVPSTPANRVPASVRPLQPEPSPLNWEAMLVRIRSDDIKTLAKRLMEIPEAEVGHQQRQGRIALSDGLQQGCLTRPEQRAICERDPEPADPAEHPLRIISQHGVNDLHHSRHHRNGFYDLAPEWHLQGNGDIAFGAKDPFWWGWRAEIPPLSSALISELKGILADPPRRPGSIDHKPDSCCRQTPLPSSRHHRLKPWPHRPVKPEALHRRIGCRPWKPEQHAGFFAGMMTTPRRNFLGRKFLPLQMGIETFVCQDSLNSDEPAALSQAHIDALRRSSVCLIGEEESTDWVRVAEATQPRTAANLSDKHQHTTYNLDLGEPVKSGDTIHGYLIPAGSISETCEPWWFRRSTGQQEP